ncbi:C1 family peptidase [Sphingomonas sp. Leaf37]|uniref:C1 family peptidase n=1 Tax=Sphingomonas sp. Leaf37 TaxID=2876552 RepID=UPI001E3136F2|nr:C1 family peptidase [Sphingomonas sp. Leaf37]
MLTIQEIEKAIADEAPGSWTAGENAVWGRLGTEGGAGLFGLKIGDNQGKLKAAAEDFDALGAPPPPPKFDWRDQDGGRLGAVRDQGLHCGACVAFATIATAESRHWVASGDSLQLSEAELFHCNGGSCDNGWGLAAGLDAATNGLVLLSDAPWVDNPTCTGASAAIKVSGYAELTNFDARRRAIAQGPVVAGMEVYEDLSGYIGGIYRKVVGGFRGHHAVCVVGYDDADGCWIARNSWGTGWGEGGYFRIAYGECKIDDLPFYSCETQAA